MKHIFRDNWSIITSNSEHCMIILYARVKFVVVVSDVKVTRIYNLHNSIIIMLPWINNCDSTYNVYYS